MKQCKECQKIKPISEFYKDSENSDRLRGKCKICYKKQSLNYNKKHKKVILERQRLNREKNREKWRLLSLKNFYNRHQQALDYANKFSKLYPLRRKAVNAINNSIRGGKIKRQPCILCGRKGNAHHPDYSMPFQIIWLCPSHHQLLHHKIIKI